MITVPVMFQFGVDEKVAVATNMFGLTFMAIGGTIPFLRQGMIEYRKISPLVILTIISSAIGAALVGLLTNESVKLMVSVAMIAVAVFILLNRDSGVKASSNSSRFDHPDHPGRSGRPSFERRGAKRPPLLKQEGSLMSPAKALVFFLTFLLGIYGGLYSGGYVTMLTAVYVAFFGMTFTEAVASTKFINVFSSSIATIIFMWQGLVDYKLGAILAVTMFVGAYAGAHYVTKLNDIWIKRIFLATVFLLAIKTLFDFL